MTIPEVTSQASMTVPEITIVEGMSPEALDEFWAAAEVETYAPGDVVHRQGDPTEEFFVLEKGAVNIVVSETGRSVYTARDPGAFVGWSSVVGRRTSSATIECVEPTRLIKIHKEKLAQIFQRHPACGLLFYQKLAREIGERLTTTYQMLCLILGDIA